MCRQMFLIMRRIKRLHRTGPDFRHIGDAGDDVGGITGIDIEPNFLLRRAAKRAGQLCVGGGAAGNMQNMTGFDGVLGGSLEGGLLQGTVLLTDRANSQANH